MQSPLQVACAAEVSVRWVRGAWVTLTGVRCDERAHDAWYRPRYAGTSSMDPELAIELELQEFQCLATRLRARVYLIAIYQLI